MVGTHKLFLPQLTAIQYQDTRTPQDPRAEIQENGNRPKQVGVCFVCSRNNSRLQQPSLFSDFLAQRPVASSATICEAILYCCIDTDTTSNYRAAAMPTTAV